MEWISLFPSALSSIAYLCDPRELQEIAVQQSSDGGKIVRDSATIGKILKLLFRSREDIQVDDIWDPCSKPQRYRLAQYLEEDAEKVFFLTLVEKVYYGREQPQLLEYELNLYSKEKGEKRSRNTKQRFERFCAEYGFSQVKKKSKVA